MSNRITKTKTKVTVQSVLVPTQHYTYDQAAELVLNQGFKVYKKADSNEQHHKFRQVPVSSDQGHFVTVPCHFGRGVELILILADKQLSVVAKAKKDLTSSSDEQ